VVEAGRMWGGVCGGGWGGGGGGGGVVVWFVAHHNMWITSFHTSQSNMRDLFDTE
jgi:hypothetical protein